MSCCRIVGRPPADKLHPRIVTHRAFLGVHVHFTSVVRGIARRREYKSFGLRTLTQQPGNPPSRELVEFVNWRE